jgi:2-alkyl-3-oxoalkanoate reductase
VKVMVTGPTGFLGRAVVDAARAAGHEVVALVRPAADATRLPWSAQGVTLLRGDLRQPEPWVAGLGGVDAVIHVAAATSGDLATQFAGTVTATENLLDAIAAMPIRMVHVSSFSVYDYASIPVGATLDESTPLEARPERRDAYTTTKLIQERLVRQACAAAGHELVVVRPGVVYGPGADWNHGAALTVGRAAAIFSPDATFRLTHVRNCADALVLALTSAAATGATLNIVDDDLPTHRGYFEQCRRAGLTDRLAVPVPWAAVATVGRAVATAARLVPDRPLRLPELLELRRQQAHWKPLRYTNARARSLLGWTPRVTIGDGVASMATGTP